MAHYITWRDDGEIRVYRPNESGYELVFFSEDAVALRAWLLHHNLKIVRTIELNEDPVIRAGVAE